MLQLKETLVWEPQHRRWRHPRIPSGLSVDGADCGVGERASVGLCMDPARESRSLSVVH